MQSGWVGVNDGDYQQREEFVSSHTHCFGSLIGIGSIATEVPALMDFAHVVHG